MSRWKWQNATVDISPEPSKNNNRAHLAIQSGSAKLSQLMVLWIGARLVLDGQLTLGQLIAFELLVDMSSTPATHFDNLATYSRTAGEFERLADILDTPEESTDLDKAKIPLPPIEGKVEFKNLEFKFKLVALVLKSINLSIPAGTLARVVGQSGSGKSTCEIITKTVFTYKWQYSD